MQIESQYKIEKAAAGKDRIRPSLENVCICKDEKKAVAVATDGRMMAVVPVVIDDDKELGLISPESLKKARKVTPRGMPPTMILNGNIAFLDDSTLPRPEPDIPFPRWQVVAKETDAEVAKNQVFSVSLDPRLLLELADAIGCEKGRGITLQFTSPLNTMRVTCSATEGVGYLMPRRDKE